MKQHIRTSLALPFALLPLASMQAQEPADGPHLVYWDSVDDAGKLFGGTARIHHADPSTITGTLPAFSTTLTSFLVGPNPANRVDLVFVGDGYTSAQLGNYANHVNAITASFFAKEPYLSYQNYFTVHRIDVVSVDSGVDNDPSPGIQRNTAMDMEYWCNDIERLLCVNVNLAYQYANNAPDVDLVCAIANSTKYGGAGYPSADLGTSAGNNGAAVEIVQHEFGHALGNLADEYEYGGPTTYTGGELPDPNVSIYNAASMAAQNTKWANWLGASFPAFDGLISTFEGGHYSEFGVYRPTNNSLMRSLGRPFNMPSCEALVIEIYRIVRPIDDASPTTTTYTGTETLFVTPQAIVGQPLAIQWSLNGSPIAGATGTTLDLTTLPLGGCAATISVTVRDNTTFVRDELARNQWMTQTLTYAVQAAQPAFTNYCIGAPNSVGPGSIMQYAGSSSVSANDLTLIASACPPGAPGLFYFGSTATQVPFGNGFRCITGSTLRLGVINVNLFGDATLPLDLTSLPASFAIQAGDTRRFQFWYRNPAGGGAGFNLSDGLAVRFCP